MKIGVDAGALCADPKRRYGTYYFSLNLIKALSLYDHLNEYFYYSFCPKPQSFPKSEKIHYLKLLPKTAWMTVRLSVEERLHKKDIFLALNQASPYHTPAEIIAFSHGLSFINSPRLYPDLYKQLIAQLESMLRRSKFIIVSSEKVRDELLLINKSAENKIKVLPFGIPFDMLNHPASHKTLPAKGKFFLCVGMEHPIKNREFITKAFKLFKEDKRFAEFKLIQAKSLDRAELKKLYRGATALLTASHYESFNLPVLEALSQNCQVIGRSWSIIPEMKKYVFESNSLREFVATMKKLAEGKKKTISLEKLKREFSWKTYVESLKNCYNI